MFAFIEGIVAQIEAGAVILNINGIGFRIKNGDPYSFNLGDQARLYTHMVSTDTDLTLYGFKTTAELELFEKLLKVSGIGPKSAHAIVASKDATKLAEAVENDDLKLLMKFPGVGKRTAQQIILDLKGKLGTVSKNEGLFAVENQALQDAIDALIALGFSEKEAQGAGKIMKKEQKELTTQEYLKLGLSILTDK
ncbi:Holliday junction branch migration protein RuvA [Xylocopilactobacillus apicola]|uniref:Holliday junction branch migration complex subunit RuvA n=1 Tax=Xylocopilactobacillus apicola TaxID=2932184 RepID=A0AAU9DDF2_9LACO|nr:Holliday junction branch migration protein RuvA [Xylocopilactobacillus apicola]BDR58847.1 Holliday junction ATP-dependent DNA helicase RuvA [Xylocopilactobacillus apicola]